jgi:ketopantoate reductase
LSADPYRDFEASKSDAGAHLAAIRSHGLKLIVDGQMRTVDLPASDDPATFGPQELVICALKAQQAHANAGAFAPLLGPRTAVLTAMNGIPWWYFYRERGPLDGHHLESVDPGGAQWNAIWTRARHRLRRRSCMRGRGARRDRTSPVQALHYRRTRRLRLGPHRGAARCPDFSSCRTVQPAARS